MIPRGHRLAVADFAALAAGGGGARVMRVLAAARRSRTMQLVRLVSGTFGEDDVAAHAAYRALGTVRRVAPAAVDRVFAHPSVGAWATRTALRLEDGNPVDTTALTGIAAAAAIRGRVPVTLLVAAPGELTLPSLGVATGVPGGALPVRFDRDRHGLPGVPADWSEDGPGWRATPRIRVRHDGVEGRFFLERWDTYQATAGVPLAAAPDVAAWREMLAASWEILVRWHRGVAEEIAEGIRVLTPLRATDGGTSSATVEDAFGCVLLSLGPDPESMAVSLAHELRHNKLVALLDLFPLMEQVPGERFYAPWREDPRPLLGLLHGTYAYVGVTDFWRAQRGHEPTRAAEEFAQTEFARWRRSTLAAARTLLGSGRLTRQGRVFVTTMAETLEAWCAEPVPPVAERNAARLSAEHERTWYAANEALDR